MQLSNHKELKTHFENNNNNTNVSGSANGLKDEDGEADGTSATPSAVIRVVMENCIYPVTLDQLHGLFSRCGKVLKIVMFTKNGVFQVYI